MNLLPRRLFDNVQCHLNVMKLVILHLLLEGFDSREPTVTIRCGCKETIPAQWCISGCQFAQHVRDPRGVIRLVPLTDPIALRIGRAACMRLHQTRTIETHGDHPEQLERGQILRVEHLDDHRAAFTQGSQPT